MSSVESSVKRAPAANTVQAQRLIDEFVPLMRSVAKCERQMGELNFTWSLIETTAKMTCPVEAKTILPTMAATRQGFGRLQTQLVAQLVRENLRKVIDNLASRAQIVADILVRNLFERTADVGFLATDADLRAFVSECVHSPDSDHTDAVARIRERLNEYRSKYTVYDDIVVLDRHGRILASLDATRVSERSSDPLVSASINSNAFVETFRASDLRPSARRALLFSKRIEDPDTGAAIGVLCLSFRFDDEMAGIFAGLRERADRAVMLLIDVEGTVVASSDPDHVALGKYVEVRLEGSTESVVIAGREYLVQTRAARGYQGYLGLGWRGQVMVPLDRAFARTTSEISRDGETALPASLLDQADALAPTLVDIVRQADRINVSLRRVVWNGEVMAADQGTDQVKLKSILQQISETGVRTSALFADAIRDLYSTVISASLADTQGIARLAIDIMDRNLYERADDCRWWALAPELRTLLAKDALESADCDRLRSVLTDINRLYTVYKRLVVFDRVGRIVAASSLEGDGDAACLLDSTMDAGLVRATLALRTSQQYHVSPFVASPLYDDQPTYIYCAAIQHPGVVGNAVGGVGIVFDATPQFDAMLRESLPQAEGIHALYVERSGRILASTDPALAVGSVLDIDARFLALPLGEGASAIIERRGMHFVLGAAASAGYREYKRSGDYRNDVIAVVLMPIGAARTDQNRSNTMPNAFMGHESRGADVIDLAIFLVAGEFYGVPARDVVEAVEATHIAPVRESSRALVGLLSYDGGAASRQPVLQVIDTRHLLGVPSSMPSSHHVNQIVIVRTATGLIGLLVDDLVNVIALSQSGTASLVPPIAGRHRLIKTLLQVDTGTDTQLISLLDVEQWVNAIRRAA
jgi:chemotaxis signal transduction protein